MGNINLLGVVYLIHSQDLNVMNVIGLSPVHGRNKMYIIYNGCLPFAMPLWLFDPLRELAINMPTDCEWMVPGTIDG